MFKRKSKLTPPPQRQVKSVYSDQIILENTLAKCECEIYLPEPSLKLGVIKGNYLLRESGTLLLGKNCMVYLCKVPIPYNPSENTVLVKDIGQDNEVYLNVVINRHNREDLVYNIKDTYWHECTIKISDTRRTFVLKFNKTDKNLDTFNEHLKHVIDTLQAETKSQNTYLLIAVPLKDQTSVKTVSPGSSPDNKETEIQLDRISGSNQSLNRSSTESDNSSKTAELETPVDPVPLEPKVTVKKTKPAPPPPCEGSIYPNDQSCKGVYDPVYDPVPPSLEAPFDPAPFVPWTGAGEVIDIAVSETESEKIRSGVENIIKPNEIIELCDSLHIHPKELPRRLVSILNSLGSISSDTDPNHQRLNSQNFISEEIYMSMGVEKKMTEPSSQSAKLQEATKIAKCLQKAINEGDQQLAVMNAVKLTEDTTITVTIEVKEKPILQEDKDPVFSLKVYIEDKDTSGGHITLRVRASDTIGDLKQRMSLKHGFPEEVQSWIIGKRIPADHETLGHCRIKGLGHSAYLYLRTARSVGLTREAYQKRMMQQFAQTVDGIPVVDSRVQAGAQVPQVGVDPTYMAMNSVPKTPAPSSAGSQASSRDPGSATPATKQTPAIKQELKLLAENLNIPTQKSSKPKQVVQGKVKEIPEDHPPEISGQEILGLLGQFADYSANAAQGKLNPRVPVVHQDEATIGWVCSACTYINKPTRPGCEVCTQTRPPDYKVPDNYVLTSAEQEWLDQEDKLDRQTKEAGSRQREYEDHEQKRLLELRKFHEALQDVVDKEKSDEANRNIYRTYNIPPDRLNLGGLFVKPEREPVETNDDSP